MFTLFPLLPTEIRLQIWKLALPGPNVLRVMCINDVVTVDPSSLPAICLVCREANLEALKFYHISIPYGQLPNTHDGSKQRVMPTKNMYFNPTTDTLHFVGQRPSDTTQAIIDHRARVISILRAMESNEWTRIRRLRIDFDYVERPAIDNSNHGDGSHWKVLVELMLVLDFEDFDMLSSRNWPTLFQMICQMKDLEEVSIHVGKGSSMDDSHQSIFRDFSEICFHRIHGSRRRYVVRVCRS